MFPNHRLDEVVILRLLIISLLSSVEEFNLIHGNLIVILENDLTHKGGRCQILNDHNRGIQRGEIHINDRVMNMRHQSSSQLKSRGNLSSGLCHIGARIGLLPSLTSGAETTISFLFIHKPVNLGSGS